MSTLTDKLAAVRLVLLDVDGVLTEGRIVYSDSGEEIKSFSVRDGYGIRLMLNAGIQVGIITGRRSAALRHRCRDLGIEMVHEGARQKAPLLATIMADTGQAATAIAFVGDDLPDLPIMTRVGCAVAVADAHEELRGRADMVTAAPGGRGAVRELAEALLKAQGKWDALLSSLME
ncbi:MAG: HAD hydrolase family protein [Pseudomonadota bacterium]